MTLFRGSSESSCTQSEENPFLSAQFWSSHINNRYYNIYEIGNTLTVNGDALTTANWELSAMIIHGETYIL